MPDYVIFFNQQWVGDHTAEWFAERGPLANAVVEEIKAAGAYVYAGGLDHEGPAFTADDTSGTLLITDGPYAEAKEVLGGLTIVNVPDEEAAKHWAGKIAVACGWPQEVRRLYQPSPRTAGPRAGNCESSQAGSRCATRAALTMAGARIPAGRATDLNDHGELIGVVVAANDQERAVLWLDNPRQ